MAKDVHSALQRIVEKTQGCMSAKAAEEYVHVLKEEYRYQPRCVSKTQVEQSRTPLATLEGQTQPRATRSGFRCRRKSNSRGPLVSGQLAHFGLGGQFSRGAKRRRLSISVDTRKAFPTITFHSRAGTQRQWSQYCGERDRAHAALLLLSGCLLGLDQFWLVWCPRLDSKWKGDGVGSSRDVPANSRRSRMPSIRGPLPASLFARS